MGTVNPNLTIFSEPHLGHFILVFCTVSILVTGRARDGKVYLKVVVTLLVKVKTLVKA